MFDSGRAQRVIATSAVAVPTSHASTADAEECRQSGVCRMGPEPAGAAATPTGIAVAEMTGVPRKSLYAGLLNEVREAGLLRRRTGYYVWKVASTVGMTVGAWVAF